MSLFFPSTTRSFRYGRAKLIFEVINPFPITIEGSSNNLSNYTVFNFPVETSSTFNNITSFVIKSYPVITLTSDNNITATNVVQFPVTLSSAYVTLLSHLDGTDGSTVFVDDSVPSRVMTQTGAGGALSTEQIKFGTASYKKTSGTADGYIQVSNLLPYTSYSTSFTYECWFYMTGNAAPNGITFIKAYDGGLSSSLRGIDIGIVREVSPERYWWQIFVNQQGVGLGFGLIGVQVNTVALQNAWHFFTVSYDGATNTGKFFIDGISVATFTITPNPSWLPQGNSAKLFRTSNSANNFYFDDVRLTIGIARYNANFTPPAYPFSNS